MMSQGVVTGDAVMVVTGVDGDETISVSVLVWGVGVEVDGVVRAEVGVTVGLAH